MGRDFCTFLYDGKNGTVLGRGGSSWGNLFIYNQTLLESTCTREDLAFHVVDWVHMVFKMVGGGRKDLILSRGVR